MDGAHLIYKELIQIHLSTSDHQPGFKAFRALSPLPLMLLTAYNLLKASCGLFGKGQVNVVCILCVHMLCYVADYGNKIPYGKKKSSINQVHSVMSFLSPLIHFLSYFITTKVILCCVAH